jgi:hypothetical protein
LSSEILEKIGNIPPIPADLVVSFLLFRQGKS